MIVACGDSVTFGQYVDRAKCWTTLLWDRLGVEVVNRGVCGDTTRLGLERFPRCVQFYEADTVLLQFGFNDANRWETDRGLPRVSRRAFAANLAEMIVRAHTFGARRVFALTPHGTEKGGRYDDDLEDYADAIRDTAPQVIDIRDRFNPAGLLLDGLHLNEDGHRVYADLIEPCVA